MKAAKVRRPAIFELECPHCGEALPIAEDGGHLLFLGHTAWATVPDVITCDSCGEQARKPTDDPTSPRRKSAA